MVIVQSVIRKYINSKDKRVSKDALAVLDKRVMAIVDSAITLLPHGVKTIQVGEMTNAKG